MTKRKETLEDLSTRRADLMLELERAFDALLDRALEEASEEGANITAIARRAGIARATIYNELARRQEHGGVAGGMSSRPRPNVPIV